MFKDARLSVLSGYFVKKLTIFCDCKSIAGVAAESHQADPAMVVLQQSVSRITCSVELHIFWLLRHCNLWAMNRRTQKPNGDPYASKLYGVNATIIIFVFVLSPQPADFCFAFPTKRALINRKDMLPKWLPRSLQLQRKQRRGKQK